MLSWVFIVVFFFKQKTAYEMRISDWSSDVCSSDLLVHCPCRDLRQPVAGDRGAAARRYRRRDADGAGARPARGAELVGSDAISGQSGGWRRADALVADRRCAEDRKSTRLNSSHSCESRMPSSA